MVFTLGIASVWESVGTRVVGMRSLISCMTRNIPYRIALFIWNVIGRFHGCKNILYKRIVTKFFWDYCLNSRVCNYGKRAVIRLLQTVIKHFIFIF